MPGQLAKDSPVLYEQDSGVAILTLNNPGRRNALSSELLGELKELLREFEHDDSVRVVVLRSEGPVFSSGHDLNELVNGDAEDYTAVFDACTRVMEDAPSRYRGAAREEFLSRTVPSGAKCQPW